MNIHQSEGLRNLLQTNDEYAKHYAHFVQDVSTSTFAECRERYEGEFYSWKNRKAWATKHHVPWDTALDSFKDFLLACGPKPAADYTLDRIDHTGPYLLANLRWADRKVQNNNKSDNVRIGVGDEISTISEMTFVRWYLLVRALQLQFRLVDAFRLGFLGYLFNFVVVGSVGGDLFKAIFIAREQPGRRAEAVATVLVDRIVGVYALVLVDQRGDCGRRYSEIHRGSGDHLSPDTCRRGHRRRGYCGAADPRIHQRPAGGGSSRACPRSARCSAS